jgi:hypothetical protein
VGGKSFIINDTTYVNRFQLTYPTIGWGQHIDV